MDEGETKSTKIGHSQEGEEDNRNSQAEQGEHANPPAQADPPSPRAHANTPPPINYYLNTHTREMIRQSTSILIKICNHYDSATLLKEFH